MALIIKGDMPDTCLSEVSSELHCPIVDGCLAFHNAYHHRFEPLENAHKCRLEDCPILGEIPDEHGRLIDADAFFEAEKGEQYALEYAESVIVAKKIYFRLQNAPTVLEASK